MHSDKKTIEEAMAEFEFIRAYRPFAYGGRWYAVEVSGGGWTAYRTRRAAIANMKIGTTAIHRFRFGEAMETA